MSQQQESLCSNYKSHNSLTANVWASLHIPKGSNVRVDYKQTPGQPQQPHYVGEKWAGCMKLFLFGVLALLVAGAIWMVIGNNG